MSFLIQSKRFLNLAIISVLVVSCAEASAAEAPIALAPVGVTINTNTPPPTPRVSPTLRPLTQPPTRTLVPTLRPTNTLAPIGRPPVRPAVQAAAPTSTFTSVPQAARSGTIREIDVPSDVLSKLNTGASESSASLGQTITVGGTVRTLDRGKARIDLNEGTVVRVAPKTLFTVTSLTQDTLNPFTRLQLAFGKVFIILTGGRMEVETPVGAASVRGSFMSVEFNEALRQLTINCLETAFNCDLSYQGTIFNLLTLQKMVVPPLPPRIQPMDAVDIKEWLINVPNSPTVIPPTATNPAPAPQPPAPVPTAANTTPLNIVVNTLTDELNSDGDCSLREAIKAANTNLPVDACIPTGGSDTITFSVNGTIAMGIGGTGEDAGLTGDYDITESLTVIGNGAANTIISGNSVDRVFHIFAGTVSLSEMTISNGNPGTSDDGGGVNVVAGAAALSNVIVSNNTAVSGGGVIVLGGTMTISGSTIKQNTATTAQGGGIFVESPATLTVYSGVVGGSVATDKNTAGGGGGGIFTRGTTLFTNSAVIQNNDTSFGNGGGVYVDGGSFKTENTTSIKGNIAALSGGGIYISSGTVQIIKSTVQSNSITSTFNNGGGIYNMGTLTIDKSSLLSNSAATSGSAGGGLYNNSATATINNSTFSGNAADSGGGGIAMDGGTVNVSFSTIAQNSSSAAGGGIKQFTGTLNIKNSVISDQTAGGDCAGTINSISGSFASDATCTGAPTAGLLTLSLGGTPAHYLLAAGSAAKDTNPLLLPFVSCTTVAGGAASPAQNGQARPTGINCDAGSVEMP